MAIPNQILNYVANAPASAELYSKILGLSPIEASPKFAMFQLPTGTILALWARDEVEPKATLPGGTEIGFSVGSDDAVMRTRDTWASFGLKILQEPTKMDFGFTCTAADLDGHRLRVFSPSNN
jgi:catechol 2,3-dioxygenase-like lactoylglutathione lyase family enzyme